MISYTYRLDAASLRQLDELRDRAANTALAKALTFTAKDAQAALKIEASHTFVLRRNWIVSGIRIRPANGSRLVATVGSIDKYMERHVVGAGKEKLPDKAMSIRSKRDGRGRLATGGILIKPYGSIGSAKVHNVVRRSLARMENQQKKPFQIKSTNGHILIVKRRTKKRNPLQVLAKLQPSATIHENWDFLGTVSGVVQARFIGHYTRALTFASRS